jgi:cob(I)alamin adenosyltransferase
MKIYTRTGDAGETGLLDGTRVPKDHLRVAAYGDLDELNATLGLVLAHTEDAGLRETLAPIQRDLFALGAQLADPRAQVSGSKPKAALGEEQVARLEQAIDRCEAENPPLTAFILPGGSRPGAFLHLARTVCRRAERALVALSRESPVDAVAIRYVNRLSDLLFVLARNVNHRAGLPEDRW